MKEKHTPTVYHCTSITEATDRANLWYISSPTARQIKTDPQARKIAIFGRKPEPLAVFAY